MRKPLAGRRVALLAHPASVTPDFTHSLDALVALDDLRITAAFGPQHGLRGDKQDNMVESPDFRDPVHGIPVWSLYGETRRPTDAMLAETDVLLVDLQDLGCRIYTFATTLRYVLEEAGRRGKAVWVLDRPNPVGRPVEGLRLLPGWESFVGAGALPMRHGLTMGELARWFVAAHGIDVALEVVTMDGWQPHAAPGYGWPLGELSWVNPSPNAANLSMARCFPGTVLLEGTQLSEGRGTTRALEVVGAPGLDAQAQTSTSPSNNIPDGWMGLDIGPNASEQFSNVIRRSKTILWNGPMGVFEMENFRHGTKSIALAVVEATKKGAFSLVGGGDSVAAVNMFGLADDVSYVSTGGGAMLEYFEGKELPGIAAINQGS
jgi:uncharacterized protein YbbC (DUF1343 family)